MNCLFCAIVAGDIPSKQIYADDAAIAFLDINPWHRGHTLVIPKLHTTDLTSSPDLLATIAPAVSQVAQLLTEKLGADGVNMLCNSGSIAGQEVFHLHIHLVPRFADSPGLRNLMEKEADIDLDAVYAQIIA